MLKNAARAIWLLDVHAVHRLNASLWTILKAHFNLKIFSDLDPTFYGQHAFQLLLILFFNRIQHTKPNITQRVLTLSTRLILTQDDIVQLLSDFRTLSIQQNILTSEPPWKTNEPLLQQVVDGLQRSPSINELPKVFQLPYTSTLQTLAVHFQRKAPVTDQAVLMRLIPVLPAASASDADPLPRAMLAQESAVPRLSADSNHSASETVLQFGSSEKAFMAHHDARPRAVPDSRQDPRPNFRKPVPQDSRNDVRPDSRPPSWERPRQDPPPDRVRRSFPDRPASNTPHRNDDDSIYEIEPVMSAS